MVKLIGFDPVEAVGENLIARFYSGRMPLWIGEDATGSLLAELNLSVSPALTDGRFWSGEVTINETGYAGYVRVLSVDGKALWQRPAIEVLNSTRLDAGQKLTFRLSMANSN